MVAIPRVTPVYGKTHSTSLHCSIHDVFQTFCLCSGSLPFPHAIFRQPISWCNQDSLPAGWRWKKREALWENINHPRVQYWSRLTEPCPRERHQTGGWPWTSHLTCRCFPSLCKMGTATVLVCSGFSNVIPQARWPIKNRNALLTVLEAGSLRPGRQHCRVRTPFWVADFLLYPHVTGGSGALSGASFIRAPMSFMRAPSLWPDRSLPKGPTY